MSRNFCDSERLLLGRLKRMREREHNRPLPEARVEPRLALEDESAALD